MYYTDHPCEFSETVDLAIILCNAPDEYVIKQQVHHEQLYFKYHP